MNNQANPPMNRELPEPMKDEVNPLLNRELYARAATAALAAGEKARNETPKRRTSLMDRAGRKVFKDAGTRRDAADLYAICITSDILTRERVTGEKVYVEHIMPPDASEIARLRR